MSNSSVLQKVYSEIYGVLVPVKNPNGIPIVKIDRDYRELTDECIPYRKLGFPSLVDFLKTVPNIVVYQSGNSHYVNFLGSENSKHVSDMVAKQRTKTYPKSRNGGYYTSPGYKKTIPSVYSTRYQKPSTGVIDQFILSCITSLVSQYPNGISKNDLLSLLRDYCGIDVRTINLTNHLRVLRDNITVRDRICYPNQPIERNSAPNIGIVDDNNYRHETDNNPGLVTDLDYDDEVKVSDVVVDESVKDAVEKNSESQMNEMDDGHHQNIEVSSVENYSEETSAKSRDDLFSQNKDYVSLALNKRTKFRLEKLIQNRPEGILCIDLPKVYEEEYKIPLDWENLGFQRLSDFASHLPDIFHVVGPFESGDFKLFDAKEPIPDETTLKAKKSKQKPSLSSVYHIYDDDSEMEAVPASIDVETSKKLSPDDVITVQETVGQISVMDFAARDDLEMGSAMVEVEIVEIYSPSFFWVHLIKKKNKFNGMMTELERFYNDNKAKYCVPLIMLERGLNVACQFHGIWHRAIIKTVDPQCRVTVMYYDYGTVKTLPSTEIFFLHRQFCRLPAQAIPCGLYGIKPLNGEEWSQRLRDHFITWAHLKSFWATVMKIDSERNSMLVVLTDTSGDEDFIINDFLLEKKLVKKGVMVRIRPKNFVYKRYLEIQSRKKFIKDQMMAMKRNCNNTSAHLASKLNSNNNNNNDNNNKSKSSPSLSPLARGLKLLEKLRNISNQSTLNESNNQGKVCSNCGTFIGKTVEQSLMIYKELLFNEKKFDKENDNRNERVTSTPIYTGNLDRPFDKVTLWLEKQDNVDSIDQSIENLDKKVVKKKRQDLFMVEKDGESDLRPQKNLEKMNLFETIRLNACGRSVDKEKMLLSEEKTVLTDKKIFSTDRNIFRDENNIFEGKTDVFTDEKKIITGENKFFSGDKMSECGNLASKGLKLMVKGDDFDETCAASSFRGSRGGHGRMEPIDWEEIQTPREINEGNNGKDGEVPAFDDNSGDEILFSDQENCEEESKFISGPMTSKLIDAFDDEFYNANFLGSKRVDPVDWDEIVGAKKSRNLSPIAEIKCRSEKNSKNVEEKNVKLQKMNKMFDKFMKNYFCDEKDVNFKWKCEHTVQKIDAVKPMVMQTLNCIDNKMEDVKICLEKDVKEILMMKEGEFDGGEQSGDDEAFDEQWSHVLERGNSNLSGEKNFAGENRVERGEENEEMRRKQMKSDEKEHEAMEMLNRDEKNVNSVFNATLKTAMLERFNRLKEIMNDAGVDKEDNDDVKSLDSDDFDLDDVEGVGDVGMGYLGNVNKKKNFLDAEKCFLDGEKSSFHQEKNSSGENDGEDVEFMREIHQRRFLNRNQIFSDEEKIVSDEENIEKFNLVEKMHKKHFFNEEKNFSDDKNEEEPEFNEKIDDYNCLDAKIGTKKNFSVEKNEGKSSFIAETSGENFSKQEKILLHAEKIFSVHKKSSSGEKNVFLQRDKIVEAKNNEMSDFMSEIRKKHSFNEKNLLINKIFDENNDENSDLSDKNDFLDENSVLKKNHNDDKKLCKIESISKDGGEKNAQKKNADFQEIDNLMEEKKVMGDEKIEIIGLNSKNGDLGLIKVVSNEKSIDQLTEVKLCDGNEDNFDSYSSSGVEMEIDESINNKLEIEEKINLSNAKKLENSFELNNEREDYQEEKMIEHKADKKKIIGDEVEAKDDKQEELIKQEIDKKKIIKQEKKIIEGEIDSNGNGVGSLNNLINEIKVVDLSELNYDEDVEDEKFDDEDERESEFTATEVSSIQSEDEHQEKNKKQDENDNQGLNNQEKNQKDDERDTKNLETGRILIPLELSSFNIESTSIPVFDDENLLSDESEMDVCISQDFINRLFPGHLKRCENDDRSGGSDDQSISDNEGAVIEEIHSELEEDSSQPEKNDGEDEKIVCDEDLNKELDEFKKNAGDENENIEEMNRLDRETVDQKCLIYEISDNEEKKGEKLEVNELDDSQSSCSDESEIEQSFVIETSSLTTIQSLDDSDDPN